MKLHNKNIGKEGESIVVSYLIANGYTILETNFSSHKHQGEIDIITKKDKLIAFIEVKRRMNSYNINPTYLVPLSKQKKIIRMALLYCGIHGIHTNSEYTLRFDIAFCDDKDVYYYENAFTDN
jgi:putative endonuclease